MAKAKIILYKSKTLKDGTHPIMLQIIHQRQTKRISLGRSCLVHQWDESSSRFTKAYPDYKKDNNQLAKREGRIAETLDWFEGQGVPFTITKFLDRIGKQTKTKSIFECFDEIIQRLSDEGKIGNMKVYRETKNAIKRFVGLKQLSFPDVDYSFLKRFESFLRSSGSEDSGIHLRIRTIRALYNEAIKLGYAPMELYPFGKTGYSLKHLKLGYNPRGLSEEELIKLKMFEFKKYPRLANSYFIFMFSYYAQGINFIDLSLLIKSNIQNGRLTYKRRKTKKFIDMAVSENMSMYLSLIPENTSDHIFPILQKNYSSTSSEYNQVKKRFKLYNQDLKEIQSILGIETSMTSYTARHTYAMSLKRAKQSDDIISHNLGHANVTVTKAYLSALENNVYDEANQFL